MARQAAHIKRTLEQLFANQSDDLLLRDHLEDLAKEPAFSGLTWFWGPALYERNRIAFRPFILNRFSDWAIQPAVTGDTWKRVEWKTHAKRLDPWLAAARGNRDVQVVRRLLRWKYASGKTLGVDNKRWCAALVKSFKDASTPAERAIVLDEFDDWFLLEESTAVALYSTDVSARAYILKHISRGYYWDAKKRAMWTDLGRLARANGDDGLYFALYRITMPVGAWALDARELARSIADPAALNAELERRHPEDNDAERRQQGVMLDLLKQRGRDVIPYVRTHLAHLRAGQFGNAKAFVDIAEANGWWDLWAAALHQCFDAQPFNSAVDGLIGKPLKEEDRLTRLKMLAGVSREWNWPGAGAMRIHPLRDDVAVRLYQRYPDLIRSAFLSHVAPKWGNSCPKLLQAAQEAKDVGLVDLLASRYAVHTAFRYFRSAEAREDNEQLKTATALAAYYQRIRATEPDAFARRASNVLTRIPADAIHDYKHLLQTNELARLLFVRSFGAYLTDARAVKDLLESSNIHVQMLAYRVLSADDPRARALAAENLDILLATVLRPLPRKTRLPAFTALANAAHANETIARRILTRAHDALKLPDKRYPKAELVELTGRILTAHPALCGDAEQPLVYGLGTETAA